MPQALIAQVERTGEPKGLYTVTTPQGGLVAELMVRQGMSAQAACHAVGYASASQFNREFKRLFGRSPLVEARRLRAGFSLPPAQGGEEYVSSH